MYTWKPSPTEQKPLRSQSYGTHNLVKVISLWNAIVPWKPMPRGSCRLIVPHGSPLPNLRLAKTTLFCHHPCMNSNGCLHLREFHVSNSRQNEMFHQCQLI